MRKPALVLAAVASACLLAGTAACSDSGPDESERTIAAIDEICLDWRATLDERGAFPLGDFDPDNPSSEDLRTVGAYFGSGELAALETISALPELSSPAAIEANLDALIAALEYQGETARMQSFAARAGDVEGFKATLVEAAETKAGVKTAAEELGVKRCAF